MSTVILFAQNFIRMLIMAKRLEAESKMSSYDLVEFWKNTVRSIFKTSTSVD